MNHKSSRAQQMQSKKAPLSMETMNQMVALYNGGQWETLEKTARDATRQHPEHVFSWKALGKALLRSGKLSEAIEPLTRAAKIAPNDADTQNDMAVAYQHLGKLEEAAQCFRTLLRLNPGNATLHDALGALLCELGKFSEAEAEFRQALKLDPNHIQAMINLGYVAGSLASWDEAETCYRLVLEQSPDFGEAHRRLGDLLARFASRSAEAIPHLQRAIEFNAQDAGSVVTLGNVLMVLGRIDESREMFRRAQQIQPLITWPCKKGKAEFSVLLLDAPGAGSTPVNYLASWGSYDCHFVGILPDFSYDMDLLLSKADVVVNMIADADNGHEVLPIACDLADKLNRPIVNHPRRIMATDRASVARRLSDIPLCRVPKTKRLLAADLTGEALSQHLAQLAMPVLIRCAGTHGGDDFEKVDNADAITAFVGKHPDAVFYLSEFIDYASADGYYRKYRVICINGQVLPYHLAIHNHWMVHHFRTDMANQAWMREEEEVFLKHPRSVFNDAHFTAFEQIGKAMDLNYCGVDCSLDRDGNIVIFESNATMLVHDEKSEPFLYKNPYIAKIKEAFDAMLKQMATQAG
jgi:Flp pilus assembly protein TadD/glutathione synthase/RimK-type ligase-like ATP-grasp enzyme